MSGLFSDQKRRRRRRRCRKRNASSLENSNSLFFFQNHWNGEKGLFSNDSQQQTTHQYYKRQKGYRLMKLFEKQSTECLEEDEKESSILSTLPQNCFNTKTDESLDDVLQDSEEFETNSLFLSKTAQQSGIPFNIWQWKQDFSYTGLPFF